jgi:hypothetical protein
VRSDALLRELRQEAEEAATWPVPGVPELARLRRRRRRQVRIGAAGSVLAVAAAAAALAVVVPDAAGPTRDAVGPAASGASSPAAAPQAQQWRARDCGPEGCQVPTTLLWRGQLLAARSGGAVPTHHGQVRSADLSISVDRARSGAWVLVGALGSGPASDLAVRFGHGGWHSVAAGRLSLLPVPHGGGRFVEARVRERARPLPDETLRIEIYSPR